MSDFSKNFKILELVDAAIAVLSEDGSIWLNAQAKILLGGFPPESLPALLADPEALGSHGLSASVSADGNTLIYTIYLESTMLSSDSIGQHVIHELHERDQRRELLIKICLVCAYSTGTMDGIYYAVSETARMLGTDCAALFVADNETRTWKSICLCTADGDNAGYEVHTDIPFDEFEPVERQLDSKSCSLITGTPMARLVSGENSAVCVARVESENDRRAVLWLERRHAPQNWTKSESSYIYILSTVLKTALRRSQMEREIKKALNEAYRANAARSEFFSSVSHEIRTPLNAVLGMLSLAMDTTDLDEIHGCLERANSSGIYLLEIINDILDISRIEAGKFTLSPHDCALRPLLDGVCDMITFAAEKKGLDFIFETQDTLPEYIFCDDQRLRQVLINLLNNAVKFTETGSVALRAHCISSETGNMLRFEVADTGTGIAPEHHDSIFTAYERLDEKTRKNTEGTGLGLRITQSIVDMMGGRIDLDSTLGKGSTFTVTIPVIPSENHSAADIDEPLSFTAPEARVLVVDDSEISLMVTAGMLRKFGIVPDTARSGQAALEMTSTAQYDIIFMDHMMPVMNGDIACRRIRSAGLNMLSPVIALTANAISSARDELLAAGMNDILTKPLFRKHLGKMLLKWLPEKLVKNAAPAAGETAFAGQFPGLNISDALERMGQSRELYHQALTLTVPAIASALEKQHQLLMQGDMHSLRIDAHGLKGVLNTIGAYDAAQLALQMENLAAAGSRSEAVGLWQSYADAMTQLSGTISRCLDSFGQL